MLSTVCAIVSAGLCDNAGGTHPCVYRDTVEAHVASVVLREQRIAYHRQARLEGCKRLAGNSVGRNLLQSFLLRLSQESPPVGYPCSHGLYTSQRGIDRIWLFCLCFHSYSLSPHLAPGSLYIKYREPRNEGWRSPGNGKSMS